VGIGTVGPAALRGLTVRDSIAPDMAPPNVEGQGWRPKAPAQTLAFGATPEILPSGVRPRRSSRRQRASRMISVQEAVRDEVRRVRLVPIFDLQRWHSSIAAVWVLTRNKKFVQACARGHGTDANTVRLEADEWKRVSFLSAEDNQARRGPVMLFPSVVAAWERLQREFGPASWDYPRSEVVERFPALDTLDRDRLMRSIWRADDPEKAPALPLSHAAWWLATKGGTEPIVLDDWKVWKPAFERLRRHLTGAQILILDQNGNGVSPRAFAQVGFDYPCRALPRSPFLAGRHTHIACALTREESVHGDQFFEAGSDAARWQNLTLLSAHFIEATAK
jgi:hypothetical protein